ncbi:hypothetical protein [Variovorax sp.]|uniref:hypothetical protein n=1 Tax=Variovorax sp. TaxID=1871043 RepID=UPI0025E5007A|nr:hypothetical protein [Variovorax sp.]
MFTVITFSDTGAAALPAAATGAGGFAAAVAESVSVEKIVGGEDIDDGCTWPHPPRL